MNGIGSRKGKVTERGGRGVLTSFARSESIPSKRPTNGREDGEAPREASVAGCSGTTAAHFFVFGSLSIIMVILYLVQEGQVPEPSRQQRLAKNNNVSRVELTQQPSSTAQEAEPLIKSSSSWNHRVDGSNGHHLPSFCNNKGNNEEEHATPISNRFDNPFDSFIDQCHTAVVSKYMPKLWRYSDHEFLPGVFIAAMNKEKAGDGGSSSVETTQSLHNVDDVVPSAHDLWPQYAYPVLASPVCLRTGIESSSSSSTMNTRSKAVGDDDHPEPEEDDHHQVVQEIFMLKQHEFQKYASRLLKTKAPKRGSSSSGGSHHQHNLANSGLVVDGSTQLPPFSSDVSSTEVAAAAHQQQQAEGSGKSLSAEASTSAGGGIVFQDFADLYRIHNPRAATSQRYMNIKKVSLDVLKQQVTAEHHQSNSPSHPHQATNKLSPRFAMILPLGQSSIFHALDGSMSNALNFVKEYFQGNSADIDGETTATVSSSSSPWSTILDVWGLAAPRENSGGDQMIGGSTSSLAKGSATTSSSTAAILNKKNRHDLGVKFALSSMTSAHHSRLVSAANPTASSTSSSSHQQQLQCYCGGTIVQDTRPLQRRFKLLPALRNRLIRAAKSELESRSTWCERAEVVNEKRNRRSVAVWKKYWLTLYRQQHGTAATPQPDVGEQSMLHAVDAFIPKDIASRRRAKRTTTTAAAAFKVHPAELLPIPSVPTNSSSSSSTSPEVGGLQHYKDALREAHLIGNGLWRRLGSKMPTLNKNKRQKNKKKETPKKKQKLAVSEWTPPPSTSSSSSSPSAAPRLLFILRNKTRLLAAPNTMRRAMLRNGFNVLTVTFDSYTDAVTKTTTSPPTDFDDVLPQDGGNGGRGSPPTKLNGDYFVSTSSVEGIQEVHDPAEQVALARYADVIVSVHGAALTWMMAQDAASPTRPPTTFAKSSSSTPPVPTQKRAKKKSSKKLKDGESNWGRQCRAVIELNHWGTKLRGVHNVYKRLAADLGLMYENVFPTDVEFFAHYNNTVVENGGAQVDTSSSKKKTSKKILKGNQQEPATTTKLRSAGDPQYDKEEQRHQQAKQRLMSNRFPHSMLEFHEQVLTYDVSDGGSSNNNNDDDASSVDSVSAVDKVLKNVWKRLVEDEECGLIL